jgi:hypothetical protein
MIADCFVGQRGLISMPPSRVGNVVTICATHSTVRAGRSGYALVTARTTVGNTVQLVDANVVRFFKNWKWMAIFSLPFPSTAGNNIYTKFREPVMMDNQYNREYQKPLHSSRIGPSLQIHPCT